MFGFLEVVEDIGEVHPAAGIGIAEGDFTGVAVEGRLHDVSAIGWNLYVVSWLCGADCGSNSFHPQDDGLLANEGQFDNRNASIPEVLLIAEILIRSQEDIVATIDQRNQVAVLNPRPSLKLHGHHFEFRQVVPQ